MLADAVSQSHRDGDYGECVVAMHVLPIKGTAQVKFKVLDGTERTFVNADAGGKRQQRGFQRRRCDVDHGGRRNRAVDK